MIGARHTASKTKLDKILEADLVEKTKKGNEAAFTQLQARYSSRIFSLVSRMMNNTEDTKDLCQVIWIHVWRKIKLFQSKSSFYTWVYSISVNLCINALHKRNRITDNTISVDDDTGDMIGEFTPGSMRHEPDIAGEIDRKQILMVVKASIKKLSAEHREVLLLSLEGKKGKEIAKLLGISEGTARSRLCYARISLRQYLGDDIGI